MLQEVTRDGRYPNAINARKKRHFFKKKNEKNISFKIKNTPRLFSFPETVYFFYKREA